MSTRNDLMYWLQISCFISLYHLAKIQKWLWHRKWECSPLWTHSLLMFRLLWALPGRSVSFLRRPTDRLPHSLEPWKAQKQAVQNWKPQSALLHTPSPFTEWHLAGCWHRGQGLRHSSLKRVLATWKKSEKLIKMTSTCFVKMWTQVSNFF